MNTLPNCNTFLTQMEPFISAETRGAIYYRINFTAGPNAPIGYTPHNLTTIAFNITITGPTYVRNAKNQTEIDFNVLFVDSGNSCVFLLSEGE